MTGADDAVGGAPRTINDALFRLAQADGTLGAARHAYAMLSDPARSEQDVTAAWDTLDRILGGRAAARAPQGGDRP